MPERKSIGILVSAWDIPLLQASHAFYDERDDVDFLVFFQNATQPPITPPVAAMNVTEAYGFSGVGVATTLATAETLLASPGPQARYFYVRALEWVGVNDSYERRAAVYGNPRLKLIARSEEDRVMIRECWGTDPVGVLADYDFTQLIEIVHGQEEDDRRRD